MTTHSLSAVSFRDPAGFVFCEQGDLRRQVNLVYRENYDRLMASGLYEELVGERLLVPHEELHVPAWEPDLAYKVIRPEPIAFISYPYEWSFSEYRDAALVALEIQRRALARGLTLKDCSVYNVQFHEGRPIFIDTLSFEMHREGRPWVGYRQFCEHFLAPLALMSLVDHRLNQLCRSNIDGVPLDLAVRMLPHRSWLRGGLAMHLHLHERAQRAHAHQPGSAGPGPMAMSRRALLGLVDSLASTVRGLRWKPRGRGWASYDQELPYSDSEFARKAQVVREFLDQARAKSAWDLGANTGAFSRIACDFGLSTVAFDFDPACVERLYLESRERRETRLLPLVMDLLNPSPATGWLNQERSSLFERGSPDLVLALALIHHLAISGNQPLHNLAAFFSRLAPWLLIEFVPETDPQVELLSAQRSGVHHEYNQGAFEKCFCKHFSTSRVERVTASGRTLYLLRRRGD
jgi:hypothetical protein